jgi:hypothetical protein
MSATPDLSSVPDHLRIVIEQRATAARRRSADLEAAERMLAEATDRAARVRQYRDDALAVLNQHLVRAGFEVGERVEVIGEVFSRGKDTARHHGAAVPDSEPEAVTAADQLADDRAAYRDATRVS